MTESYNINIELTEEELLNLKSFLDDEDITKVDIFMRYLTLERLIKAVMTERDNKERIKRIRDPRVKCKCGHGDDWHSPLGDRVCCRCDCGCLTFKSV